MNPQLADSMDRIASETGTRCRAVLDAARNRSEQAAAGVTRTKASLDTLAGLGLKLSGVSHRASDRLMKQHLRLLEHQLDSLALRFRKTAKKAAARTRSGTSSGSTGAGSGTRS